MVDLKILTKVADLRESVELESKRLAPFLFFTRKKYLEDFVPNLLV